MQLQLDQTELEIALQDYVVKMGITRPIENIVFTAARSQGGKIITEINLQELSNDFNDPTPNRLSSDAAVAAVRELEIGSAPEAVPAAKDLDAAAPKPIFG